MKDKIDIPEGFADIIASANKVRSGQTCRYGPYEEVYSIILQKEYDACEEKDRARILDFCQKHCHKCKYTQQELMAIKQARNRSFNELMSAVVVGSYILRHGFVDKKEVEYTWSQGYLD